MVNIFIDFFAERLVIVPQSNQIVNPYRSKIYYSLELLNSKAFLGIQAFISLLSFVIYKI